MIIDMAIPGDTRVCDIEWEKMEKRWLLKDKIARLWQMKQVQIGKGPQRSTAKQRWRPKDAKWHTRNLENEGSIHVLYITSQYEAFKTMRLMLMGLLQVQIVKYLRIETKKQIN